MPWRLYFKSGRVKLELALVKGKKLWDKRRDIQRPRHGARAGALGRALKAALGRGTRGRGRGKV